MSGLKPITEHICEMLRERSARGLAKYGTTIDRGDLSRAEWLQHLLEELLDAAQYVEAAKRQAPPKIVAVVDGTNARVSLHRGESPAKLAIEDDTGRAVILLAGDVAASIVTLLGGNGAALVGRPLSFPPAPPAAAVPFLCNGSRFKVSVRDNGSCGLFALPRELGGQWVALVDATDGKHLAQQPAAAVPEGYAAAIRAVQEMMPPRDFRPSAQVWLTGNQVNELHARLDAAAMLAAAPEVPRV